MSLMKQDATVEKPLSRGMWWFFFLIATFITSLAFKTFGLFTLQPNLQNGLLWLLVLTILFQAFGVLAYDSYVQEKAKGKVQKPVRLFEWMIQKRFLLRMTASNKGNTP